MNLLTQKSLSILVRQFEELLSDKIAKTHETEIKDKDQNTFNIELSSFFLSKKEDEDVNFVVLIRDISDRKKAEIEIARAHELLQTLMDNIPDSIYFKDEKNQFVMVNKAKAAHVNVSPEDMIGKTDFDFMPEDQARQSFEDDEEVMKTGKFIVNKIEKFTDNNGADRWISVTKVPRFDEEGNIIGTVGISRDITEWKKLEENRGSE
jgi:PAS domain S-box-containing protein